MDMGSHSSMDMGSSSMDMASSTMNMASSTMSMAMSSSSMDMGSEHSGMDMSMPMHMYFTTNYQDYPVLFKGLHAKNAGQAFGIFLLLFVVAFLVRGIEFSRNYLEQRVWKNPSYVDCHPGESAAAPVQRSEAPSEAIAPGSCCGGGGETETDSHNSINKNGSGGDNIHLSEVIEGPHAHARPNKLPLAASLVRDVIRLALCILPDLFGFALMLAAMTYTLTYFFAVVLGLGIGRFTFEKLSDSYALKPVGSNGGFHCT